MRLAVYIICIHQIGPIVLSAISGILAQRIQYNSLSTVWTVILIGRAVYVYQSHQYIKRI